MKINVYPCYCLLVRRNSHPHQSANPLWFCGTRQPAFRLHNPRMSLSTISESDFNQLVPKLVTPDQWRSYWGVNKMDRLQRILESVLIAFGGAWVSWFLSFLAGGTVAAIVGTLLIFNWMYAPWLTSRQNNEFIRKGNTGKLLKHALYKGRISRINRENLRISGTISAVVTQDFMDLLVADEADRVLEIRTPWRDGYNQLRIGMTYATVVASSKSDFSVVSALTDGYIPACNAWVGDYPYLQKKLFRRYVANESVDHVVNRREPDKTISTDYTSDNKVANAKKGGDFANEYDGSDY